MELTYIQLDALRELASIGSGNAATAFASIVGLSVDVSVPDVRLMPLAEAVNAAGPSEKTVTGVLLPVIGDLEALVLLLFDEVDAGTLCGLLGVEAGTETALSALGEIANVLGAAYVNAVGSMIGLELEPAPPQAVTEMLGAIVATVFGSINAEASTTLYIDSDIILAGGLPCSFSFLLVPTEGAVMEILTRLGLAG
jgi:chemotaxis protein CheC